MTNLERAQQNLIEAHREVLRAQVRDLAAGRKLKPVAIQNLINLDDLKVNRASGLADETAINTLIDEAIASRPHIDFTVSDTSEDAKDPGLQEIIDNVTARTGIR